MELTAYLIFDKIDADDEYLVKGANLLKKCQTDFNIYKFSLKIFDYDKNIINNYFLQNYYNSENIIVYSFSLINLQLFFNNIDKKIETTNLLYNNVCNATFLKEVSKSGIQIIINTNVMPLDKNKYFTLIKNMIEYYDNLLKTVSKCSTLNKIINYESYNLKCLLPKNQECIYY